MKTNDSSYAKIIDLIRGNQKQQLNNLATIISIDPLEILVGELKLDKDNLLLNSNLSLEELKINDRVLISRSGQQFIIICKVVSV